MESLPLVNLNKQEGQTRHEILLPFFPYTFFSPTVDNRSRAKTSQVHREKVTLAVLASSLAAE